MNGAIEEFKQSLNNQPATQKTGQKGHYCAPRVKSPLLDRILKLGGKEMPATDKEFWVMTPKVNEFILVLLGERVTELEKELEQEPVVEPKKEPVVEVKKVAVKH